MSFLAMAWRTNIEKLKTNGIEGARALRSKSRVTPPAHVVDLCAQHYFAAMPVWHLRYPNATWRQRVAIGWQGDFLHHAQDGTARL